MRAFWVVVTAFVGMAMVTEATPSVTVVEHNDFSLGHDGWSYRDDTHFNTTNPSYAWGFYSDNKLKVKVGGRDDHNINGMSGGWEYHFHMAAPGKLEVKIDYSLYISNQYESNEFGEAVVELDGVYSIAKRLIGHGGIYSFSETDKTITFSYVDAGWHTITLGAHNNRKTYSNEWTWAKYDTVKITLHGIDPVVGTCTDYHLDFEGPQRGEYITDYFQANFGVTMNCTANNAHNDGRCRIFDSSNPQGYWSHADAVNVGGTTSYCTGEGDGKCGDPDLGSPNNQCNPPGPGVSAGNSSGFPGHPYENCIARNNLLIVDENGPNYAPDDAVGGTIEYTFDGPVHLDEICYIDIDGKEDGFFDIYFDDDTVTLSIKAVVAGDNGYACTNLSFFSNVIKLKFRMDGSGSTSDLVYKTCDGTTTTTSTTSTTVAATTTTTTTTTSTPAVHNGGGGGDPHFKRWGQAHDTFHGECDLVMVHSDNFHDGTGLDLHVRTTIETYFSYIETAALRIGDHILEIHRKTILINDVELSPADLPLSFGDKYKYIVSNGEVEEGKNPKFYRYYEVELHDSSTIIFRFYKQYLTIAINGHTADFADSVGLLGEYGTGAMISRDGSVMADFKEYGFEWQVSPDDPTLFAENRSPQLPLEMCRMPSHHHPARRALRGANEALAKEAAVACAHVKGKDFLLCLDDVMITGEVGLAGLW